MFVYRLASAIALAAKIFSVLATELPPSQDPWYQAPPGYEKTTPGTVLKFRAAPGNLTASYGNSSSTWNVLYRSTDSNYQPAWAVTTVFVPKQPRDEHTLLSYQIPYNTPDVDGSPSYLLNKPAYVTTIVGQDIQTLLSYGWFVSVPDHEGPTAAFVCSVSEGHATLDSIRAVRSLKTPWAPSPASRVAMWGYSGGSLASEFAAELQVQYAPELEIAGMAIGGLPTNASTTVRKSSGTYFAGLVAAGLLGLSKEHPGVNQTVRAALKQSGPYNASTFLSANHLDINSIFSLFAYQDMGQYFTNGLDVLNSPAIVQAVETDSVMGYHGTPKMPMFVYKAINDELCPIDETDALLDRYCNDGASVVYQKNSIGGHFAEETNGDASALKWLRSVLEGNYNRTGCTTEIVALNVTDSPL